MSNLPFPVKVLEQHAAVLGKTGAGKSSAMRVVVEHLLSHNKRVCVVDPKGDWYGLKSGFSVITFGTFKGEYEADVPLNKESGAHVAELICTGNRPAVIGFRGWFTADMLHFWIAFSKTLFHSNEGELFLFIDEAQNFAPKGSTRIIEGQGGLALHWTNRLLAEGRGLGMSIWVGSQRPQKVHNDTLDGCETLIAMRTVHPAARLALANWMKGAGDKAAESKILSSIGEMPRGEAWIWSPEIGFGPKHVVFPMFQTFDSFAPPQLQKKISQRSWADVDLDAVKEKLASVIKEAQANDPKSLKLELNKVRAELSSKNVELTRALEKRNTQIKIKKVKVPVVKDGHITRLEKLVDRLEEFRTNTERPIIQITTDVIGLRDELKRISSAGSSVVERTAPQSRLSRPDGRAREVAGSSPAPRIPVVQMDQLDGELKINRKQQEILDALLWFESIGNHSPTGVQVGAVAMIDSTGGYFSNMVGPLVTHGLITRGGGVIQLTEEGRKLAQLPDSIASISDYHEMLKRRVRKVKSAGQKTVDMLTAIIARGGHGIGSDELGAEVGIDHTGGYFSNMIGPLSTLGLIRRAHGRIEPTEIIFPPGLV